MYATAHITYEICMQNKCNDQLHALCMYAIGPNTVVRVFAKVCMQIDITLHACSSQNFLKGSDWLYIH